ncbi:MAG: hypothetical protein WDN72_01645 [Alphaproteobacteria bacterium]
MPIDAVRQVQIEGYEQPLRLHSSVSHANEACRLVAAQANHRFERDGDHILYFCDSFGAQSTATAAILTMLRAKGAEATASYSEAGGMQVMRFSAAGTRNQIALETL